MWRPPLVVSVSAMTEREPARGPEQRKQDTLDRLEKEEDAWVATASADGVPCLVPLSFVWHRGTLLLATRRTNPTAVNVNPSGQARITLGHTRDVVLIEGTAELVEGVDLPAGRLTPSPRSSAGTRADDPAGCICASPRTP